MPETPPGSPGLPPGVSPFNPPTTGPDVNPGVPRFTESSRIAGPGETLALVGDEFSTFAGDEAGKDSRFLIYAQSTPSNGRLREGVIQKLQESFAAVTLAGDLPSDAMTLVWAQNDAGNSLPVAVNRTEAWWVGPDAAAIGEAVSVYGTNLASGPNRDQASVYLVPSGGTSGVWVPVTRANPYRLEFTVPGGLANGNYEVWVHNHRGGTLGWSTPRNLDRSPMLLEVRDPLNWTGPVFNVKDAPYNASGDGINDDLAAITSALTDASAYVTANPTSRPTVYLPEGTYNLYGALRPASNVRIQGAGRDASGNWLSRIQRAEGPRVAISFSGNMNDLTRNNNHALPTGNPIVSTASGAGWKAPFGSVTFDGASYLTIPQSPTLNIGPRMTVFVRIKGVTSTAGFAAQTLFSRSSGGQKVFARIRSGLVEFGYNLGLGDVVVSTPFNFNTSSTAGWVSLAFVYNGTAWQIYQATSLRASRADAQGVPALTGPWYVGGDPTGPASFLTGQLDTIRVYARSLGADERQSLANAWLDEGIAASSVVTTASVSGLEFDNFEIFNPIVHFTTQQPMGLSVASLGGTDLVLRNLKVSAGFFRGLSIPVGSYRVKLLDSTIVSNTNFTGASQVFVENVDFFGTGDAEQLLAADGGVEYLSISNCRGRDFLPTGLWEHSAGGRFFTGSVGAGSQRFIYIGENETTDLAARTGKSDQNAGEQILWDQNTGNLVRRTLAGATANTITIQEWVGSTNIGNTDSVLVSGGRGIGQHRRILSRNVATGVVTIDRPWDVVPDGTSIILTGKVVSYIVIYDNRLDGKSDYAARVTASSGVNFFNNGNDTYIDSNVISDVRAGINLNGYTQGAVSLPVQNVAVINNQITNVVDAFRVLGAPNLIQPAVLATVWRNNTALNMTETGLLANTGVLNIFENNSFTNLPVGVGFGINGVQRTDLLVLKDNVFDRGTATEAGSAGIVLVANNGYHQDPTLVGNTFTGFATTGANTSTNRYGANYVAMASANNGKVYGARGIALSQTAADVIQVFDPAKPLERPGTFLQASLGGLNSHLMEVNDLLFTNTAYAGPSENPLNCTLFTANRGAGTVSRYDFDHAGTMTYAGEVVAGLGRVTRLAQDAAGNLYILTADADLIAAGSQPRLYRWNGTTLSLLIDTPLFRYGTNTTIRTPAGICVDAQGRIFITLSGINGTRRFNANGTLHSEIPLAGGIMRLGENGKIYMLSGRNVVEYDPDTGAVATVVNGSTLAAISQHTNLTSFTFGRNPASDLSSGGQPSIYLTSSGGSFAAIYGPGTTLSGTLIALRDPVYPQLQMQPRAVQVTSTAGATVLAPITIRNVSLVDVTYSVASSAPWLTVSGTSPTLPAQQTANLTLTVNTNSLGTGTRYANFTITYNNAIGSTPRTLVGRVALTIMGNQLQLNNLRVMSCGDSRAELAVDLPPQSLPTIVTFEYGQDEQLGNSATAASIPANSGSVTASVIVSALFPHTSYHYRATATNTSGSATTNLGTFRTIPQSDQNADGIAELVCISPTSRQTQFVSQGSSPVVGPNLPIQQTLVAAADMNLDTKSDWVLINPETRQVSYWYMDGPSVVSTALGPQLPAASDVQAVEDFDGDGNMDLLTRNGTSSVLEIRRLNATGGEIELIALTPPVPAGFVVAGVDFINAAGTPDIVLFNPSTGATRLLAFDGNPNLTVTNGDTIPAPWLLVGVDAFLGSDRADWLLYDPSTGATEIWVINGGAKISSTAGPSLSGDFEPVGARSAVTSQTTHPIAFTNGAVANNGKIYLAMNRTLTSTSGPVVRVFDPASPEVAPATFLSGVSGGTNSHLNGTRGIVFTNTAFAGSNTNPVNCSMYLLNSIGTLSRYNFDAAGTMTYAGDVVTGLGAGLDLALEPSGSLLILTTDSNLSLPGSQPRLYRWDGSVLTVVLDTIAFRFGTNPTTRTPGGVAVDAAGNIYIPFTGVNGMRRFPAGGGAPFEIPLGGGSVRVGPDGNVYFLNWASIRQYNPITNTLRLYSNSNQIPATMTHTRYQGLVFGPKSLLDLNPGAPATIFSSSSGSRFFGVNGPGSANPGTQAW